MEQNFDNLQALHLAVKLEHLLNRLPIGNKISQDEIRINPSETIGKALRIFAVAEPFYSETACSIADHLEYFNGLNLDAAIKKDTAWFANLTEQVETLSNIFVKSIE